MSQGYNVTTPAYFKVRDPAQLVQANLNTLNATVVYPDRAYETVDGEISANALLGGYVHIVDAVQGDVTTDSASNIVAALKLKLQRISNDQIFQDGTRFSCALHNMVGSQVTIVGGANVTTGDFTMGTGSCGIVDVIVTEQFTGAGGSADRVCIIGRANIA